MILRSSTNLLDEKLGAAPPAPMAAPSRRQSRGTENMTRELDAILRTDFLAFARKAIQELTGETLSNDPYLEYLGSELGRFIAGDTRRLIVNLPPRHLKTYLCSICLAAWEFAHRPSARIMIVTCAEHLAQSIARGIRDILQASWFKDLFETRVASNHSAVMDFSTTS